MLSRLYGLSRDEYAAILWAQGGVCAICRRPETARTKDGRPRPLAVDHDHKTGVIRGLLCTSCNTLLGKKRDEVGFFQRAAVYLMRGRLG
jgi:hypothetical protein